MAGYITPAETAEYQFYISSDDASELWLSTDESEGNLVKIATESISNGVRDYPTNDRRSKVDVYELTVTGTADDSAASDSAAAALAAAKVDDADAKAAAAAATAAMLESMGDHEYYVASYSSKDQPHIIGLLESLIDGVEAKKQDIAVAKAAGEDFTCLLYTSDAADE